MWDFSSFVSCFSLKQESSRSVCASMQQFALYSSSWRTVEMRAATGWSSFMPPGTNFDPLNRSEFIDI